ncbi:MAG TPA: nucleotidyltransferase family protein [Gaiellaceae bacterium]
MESGATNLWAAVDRLIDSTDDVDALKANRLHLLAARRWRELGRDVPAELVAAERVGVLATLVLPELLARLREACDGPLVVHKGPEVALRYPDPVLRPFIDVDLLVPDAASVQTALVDAGFVEVGNPVFYAAAPHRLPLEWPGIPVLVEVHADLNWPPWLGRSPTDELLARAVPSSLGVDGVQTLESDHHVLAVAAHAWAHGPFTRVGDLVDVAALMDGLDRGELLRLACRWNVERMWRTTLATVDAVLFEGPPPWAVRTWARNLPAVRERTVLEIHVGRWLAGFSAVGALGGFRALGQELGKDLRPAVGETWGDKLARVPKALRDAFVTRSKHDRRLEERENDR